MNKNLFLKSIEVNLIQVNCSLSHVSILFKILKERKLSYNISHSKLPTFEKHKKFVKSIPYRYWFLIRKAKDNLGVAYITKNNEISIKLTKDSNLIYKETLNFILKKFKPLRAIPSKRNSNFVINLSPEDKYYVRLLTKIGAKKIQETYKYKT